MLTNADLIILTAAVYLGGVLSSFFTSLSQDIVLPLLAPVAAAGKGVTEYQVSVGGVTLKVGEVLTALVQLLISFFLVVVSIGFLRTYFLSKIGASRPAM